FQWAQLRGTGASPPSAPPPGRPFMAAPSYYPGTADLAAAGVVVLRAGEERADVDFSTLRIPTARVTGTVVGPEGQPVANAVIARSAKQSSAMFLMSDLAGTTRTAADGTFSYSGVPPGEYVIVVRSGATPSAPTPGGRGGGGAAGGFAPLPSGPMP